jgi:hypothetical protein
MRPDSSPSAQAQQKRKLLWHGPVYENFRNDVLDAIPHEVKQNGESKSPLRRNQFGFNVDGPLLIPHLIKNPENTFFMLSYEGVRERVFRAAEIARVVTDLQDLDRRREAYLTSIIRRYRDITSQFRAMGSMLDSGRDPNASTLSDAALTRIQNAVSLADDDLRQFSELNARAHELQKKLVEK